MKDNDFELLRRFTQGNCDAFTSLTERHTQWLYAAARRRLHDEHLADDTLQTVLLILSQEASNLVRSNISSVSAWLFRVMHFTCSTIRRTHARRVRHEAARGIVDLKGQFRDDVRFALIEDVIAQLPARDREAVVRRFYQHESFAEIGQALALSEEAARKRVMRILARCRESLLLEGVDGCPEEALNCARSTLPPRVPQTTQYLQNLNQIKNGAMIMAQQMEAMQFAVMTAEFYVKSVEDNLDYFEKLGFRRHFVEADDAEGSAPRASLRGGHARIWLRRATRENPPAPGVTVYVWLDGGEEVVVRHRESIAAQGVVVNQFFYDGALMNFTVTTPDGYTVGFFSTYTPHTFDPALDG